MTSESTRGWAPPLLAAALLLAVGGDMACGQPSASQPPPANSVRGSGLQLLSPAGEASGPIEFRWSPSDAAAAYRLRFIDGREREIYTIELTETRHALPSTVLDQMEAPVTYFWRVDALDKDGNLIETTRMVSFLWTR